MTIPEIVTGDSIALAVTLKKNSAVFVIPPASIVKAALVSTDHLTQLTAGPVTLSNAAPGANWAASLVVVELLPAATMAIAYQGLALLEIQVDDAGRQKTWFVPVRIITGRIS